MVPEGVMQFPKERRKGQTNPQHQPGIITSKCNNSSARILAVQTTQDKDLTHAQQEGNHAWNWTPT